MEGFYANLIKIAKLANVSVSTASKAFSMSPEISEETREIVFDTAYSLDFEPDIPTVCIGHTGANIPCIFSDLRELCSTATNTLLNVIMGKEYDMRTVINATLNLRCSSEIK